MSHIKQKSTRKSRAKKIFVIGCLFLCLFNIADFFALTANAATATQTSRQSSSFILKANLSDLTSRNQVALDWKEHSYEIRFDLSQQEWYDKLDLFLSVYPEGNVNKKSLVVLTYNGSDPIVLRGQGSRFDAHIRLDPSRIRKANNIIKIRHHAPSSTDCLTQEDGKWIIDLARSKLIAHVHSRQRNLQISEIEPRLAHPMTSPKRVAIIAKGEQTYALEAILAQGIALRTFKQPKFQFTQTNADFVVLAGTHTQLRPYVHNKSLLKGNSALVSVDTGLRPKLILTAPNEKQLMMLTKAFASHHLSSGRMNSTALFEFYANASLQKKPILNSSHYALADIGSLSIAPTWNPQASALDFNVEDAIASSGQLTLQIGANPNTNPQSILRVSLNDHPLGYTYLNKKTKKVAFDITEGMLRPSGNRLTVHPEYVRNSDGAMCTVDTSTPSVTVSSNSKFVLTTAKPTPMADLSRLVASGAPFQQSVHTRTHKGAIKTSLYLTAQRAKDRIATLHFLAFAARQFGPQWVNADYINALPTSTHFDQNILIIGPNIKLDAQLYASAPSALKQAIGGKSYAGVNVRQSSEFRQQASADALQAFQIAARQISSNTRINSGGVASLFPSPYAQGRILGIITSTKPSHYSQAMHTLSQTSYWDALQGSVARWDKNAMLMAQVSTYLPNEEHGNKAKSSSPLLAKLNLSALQNRMGEIGNSLNVKALLAGHTRPANKYTYVDTNAPRARKPISVANIIPTPHLKPTQEVAAGTHQTENTLDLRAMSTQTLSTASSLSTKVLGVKTSFTNFGTKVFNQKQVKIWFENIITSRIFWLMLILISVFFIMNIIGSNHRSNAKSPIRYGH